MVAERADVENLAYSEIVNYLQSLGITSKNFLLTLKVKGQKVEAWVNGHFLMTAWHAFFLNNGLVQNTIARFLKARSAIEVASLNDKEWDHSIGSKIARVK